MLVQDDMLRDLVDNFTGDATYEYLYLKQNHYKVKDTISNTKFNLTLAPQVKGCIASSKFDGHGIKLNKKQIIKNGKLINYLDTEKDEDLNRYQDSLEFEKWLNKYIYLK